MLRYYLSGHSDDSAAQTALFILVPTYLTTPEALLAPTREWVAEAHRPPPAISPDEILGAAWAGITAVLLPRFVRRREPGHSASVVGLVIRAIELLGPNHVIRVPMLGQLGSAVLVADPAGDQPTLPRDLLDEAVRSCREAVGEETPLQVAGLAALLRARAEATGSHEELLEAVRLFRAASNQDSTTEREVGRLAEEHLQAVRTATRNGAEQADLFLADLEVWLDDPRLSPEERARLDEDRARLAASVDHWRRAVNRTPAEVLDDMLQNQDLGDDTANPMVWLLRQIASQGALEDDGSAFGAMVEANRGVLGDMAHMAVFLFRLIRQAALQTPMPPKGPAPTIGATLGGAPEDLAEILALLDGLRDAIADGTRGHDLVELAHLYLMISFPPSTDRATRRATNERLGALLLTLPERLAEQFPTRPDAETRVAAGIGRQSPFGTMGALAESIDRLQEQLDALADDDPERPAALAGFAHALFLRYLMTSEDTVFPRARDLAREAVSASSSPEPDLAFVWAMAVFHRARGGAASLEPSGSSIVLMKILDGDRAGALTALERTRGSMLSAAFVTRAELRTLRAVDPDLAAEFSVLRSRSYGGGLVDREADRRETSAREEWTELLGRVRSRPGFDRFLLPRTLAMTDVAAASAEGPVIAVNVTELRSHALVLRDGDVDVVALPALRHGDLRLQTEAFHDAIRDLAASRDPGTVGMAGQVVRDTLAWLWDVLAEPVVEALRFGPRDAGPWPRVWWSASGPLSLLPLHAAGRHDEPGASLLDRVVSSSTPTLRALIEARAERGTGRPTAAVAVTMPETEGQAPLPAAADEAGDLARRFSGLVSLVGPEATRDSVNQALPMATLAHFACHAASDPDAPWASHVLLADGPLSVVEVSDLALGGAELAYLSACATARGGSVLSDEAVHIASAFQLAGFAQAVGTLWPVEDLFAARAANEFYAALTDEGERGGAIALHTATRALRGEMGDQPWRWAAYVHSGA